MKQSSVSIKLLNYKSLFLHIAIFLILFSKSTYCAEDTDHDHEGEDHDHDHKESSSDLFSTKESWGYGLLTGVMLGVLGFVCSGVVILLKKYTSIQFDPVLKILIAFAAGALIGDAVIHLIPHAFSSHSHSDEHNETSTEAHTEEEEETVSPKLLSFFIVLGIFIFALIERLFHILGIAHTHGIEHSHSHSHVHSEGEECNNGKSQTLNKVSGEPIPLTVHPSSTEYNLTNIEKETLKKNSGSSDNQDIQEEPTNKVQQQTKVEEEQTKQIDLTIGWKHKKPEGYMNLIADFLHNIMDGIALGVSFTSSTKSKAASTIVAIVAHEIPQEMGDVSILLNSNFSGLQALVCNGVVNFSGLIGIIIGIAVASLNEKSERIMNCFIAGNFLFIGATEMLPKISEEKNNKVAFLQLLGLCVGFGIMFLITLAESDDEHDH